MWCVVILFILPLFLFISTAALLKDLLASADLVSEPPEYVALMKDKLDPEGLDIIVLSNFLQEFYGDADFDAINEVRDVRNQDRTLFTPNI